MAANIYPASRCGRCGGSQAVNISTSAIGWLVSCAGCSMDIPPAFVTFATAGELQASGWQSELFADRDYSISVH